MKAYIFPGQGSQRIGMGANLFDKFPDYVDKANEILGYDVAELCLNGPMGKLSQTQYTQPALYVFESLLYLDKIENEKKPDFLAGHSLGEYVALFAAEVFDFETGLRLVQKRGELMSQQKNGGMAAVLNVPLSQLKDVLKRHNLATIEIANLNSPTQTVLAGSSDEITSFLEIGNNSGLTVIPLFVSGAFHSSYMKPMQEQFAEYLKPIEVDSPKITVIANYTAKPYNAKNIKSNLINQITNSVRWVETANYIHKKGVNEFEEIGLGDTLTKLFNETLGHTSMTA